MRNPINRWQVAKQIEWLLNAALWTDSPFGKVFGWAATSDLPVEQVAQFETVPFALLRPGSGEESPEHPEYSNVARFDLDLVTIGETDMEATSALMGGNPVSGDNTTLGFQGDSQGKGLLQLEERVRLALDSKDESLGMLSVCTVAASGVPAPLPDGRYMATSKLEVKVYGLGRDRFYTAPLMLTAAGVAGTVTLTWALPAARWDTLGLELYYQAGSTPPAYGGGTKLTLGVSDTSRAVVTGAGTWSFALFRTYDETGNGNVERTSPAATASGVTA